MGRIALCSGQIKFQLMRSIIVAALLCLLILSVVVIAQMRARLKYRKGKNGPSRRDTDLTDAGQTHGNWNGSLIKSIEICQATTAWLNSFR